MFPLGGCCRQVWLYFYVYILNYSPDISHPHPGIIGKIQTADGSPLTSAVIHHGDHTHVLAPDEDGMFRRLLPVGIHGVTASAPGYMPLTKDVHVTINEVICSEMVVILPNC